MTKADNLQRFLSAHETAYSQALSELKRGRKTSHWMWFIFPQLAALGRSETARFYGIADLAEATNYLLHPVLGARLIESSQELLKHHESTANQILGSPDDLKLGSCMTLFASVEHTESVFNEVLNQFYRGVHDQLTIELIKNDETKRGNTSL